MQDIFEAAPLFAEAIFERNFEILDEELVGIDRLAAHLLDLAHRDPAAVEIGIEQAQAVGRAFHFLQRRGARQQQDLLGDLRGRNPDLLAVDDIFVALAHRARLQLRGVEAGVGFGHGKTGPLRTRDDRRQHPLALLLGAEHDDGIEPEHVHMHGGRARHAGAGFRDRAHHDRGIHDAETRAAIFLRDADAEPAGIRQRAMEIGGVSAFLVLLQPIGVVEARADFCNRVADRFLVGCQRKIHGVTP